MNNNDKFRALIAIYEGKLEHLQRSDHMCSYYKGVIAGLQAGLYVINDRHPYFKSRGD